jgi:UDP-N-acetylmuramoylalanine--D-glutamate ligase
VQYYDDSKATNPHATLSAVRGFDRIDGRVVLVAGGRNKGLDLSVLRELAPRLRGVIAIGEAAADVEAAFAGAVPTAPASSMKEAVVFAARRAQPGDVVLLSPACASFDWYPSYGARGDDFAHEVARLSERGVA